MKPWITLNLATPLVLAIALVLSMRWDGIEFLFFLLLVIVVLGLALTSLVAPVWLWRKHGVRSLLVPLAALASATLAVGMDMLGSELVLRGTPVRPKTFLRGSRQDELQALGDRMLRGPDDATARERLGKLGFHRVDVDTFRRVVRMSHVRYRTWYTYFYAPDGLPGRYAKPPRLVYADMNDWSMIRRIARTMPRGAAAGLDSTGSIAVTALRRALGDSVLADIAARDPEGRMFPNEWRRVIGALNEQVRLESGLVSDARVTFEGDPAELRVESRALPAQHWATALLKELVREGVVERQPDACHLRLRPGLTDVERARVEWLQLGLLQRACDDLVDVDSYPYDRKLRDHWYVRVE